MQQFYCSCGQPLFFDSERCVGCGARLGFDPASMSMLSLTEHEDGILLSADRAAYRLCDNGLQYGVCNWVKPASEEHPLCWACQFNRTVPNQSLPGNQLRWRRLEEGKKRLFYTLLQLGVPLVNGWIAPRKGLLLDFIEDSRSEQPLYQETFVTTGYRSGVITINTLEADDAAREAQRLQMKEDYRTVLGHMRHESGHYYWQLLAPRGAALTSLRDVFGDESADYRQALDQYYERGPQPDWQASYISAYASAHPAEDWAESWGHYLHIYDALETAAAHGLLKDWPSSMSIDQRIDIWRTFSITLNELNRSVGKRDAYPFLLNEEVAAKLATVDQVIDQLRGHGRPWRPVAA